MQKPAKYASLMSTLDNGTAIVLPAYETGDAGDIGVEVAREAVLGALRRGGGRGQETARAAGERCLVPCVPAALARLPDTHTTLPHADPGSTVPSARLGAEGKDAAVRMFWDGRIKAFHTDRYEAGHRATNYKRWLEAARPYPIQ